MAAPPGLTEPPQLPEPQWLAGPHGRLAFCAYTVPNPRLHLLVSHGFGEHRGWWHHVACAFRERGVSTYLFDHYHHGQSDGLPGDIAGYGDYVDGLLLALEHGVQPHRRGTVQGQPGEGAPLVLLSHSQGALVTLLALEHLRPFALSGLVFSAPLLGMHRRGLLLGTLTAALISLIDPTIRITLASNPHRLTTLEQVWPSYGADPLRVRQISARFFRHMRAATKRVRRLRNIGGLPVLLLRPGDERVVDSEATQAWWKVLEEPDKSELVHPGLRHELFNDRDWELAVEQVVGWAEARLALPPGTPPGVGPAGNGDPRGERQTP